jgi:hypothetical protein
MRSLLILAGLLVAVAASAQSSAFDPAPWLADLDQARRAVDEKYANRDWLVEERRFDLDGAFARARSRLQTTTSDSDARRIVERLFERFRDGHVAIEWPSPPSVTPNSSPPQPLCKRLGYDGTYIREGTASHLPGWRALPGSGPFEAGLVQVGNYRLGTLRIGLFMPNGLPALCEAATDELKLTPSAACDSRCADRVLTLVYRRMTEGLMRQIEALDAVGADALLVDIGDNGGGSEWAEAAARMFTPKRIVSARRTFVRGPHWAGIWREHEAEFRAAAAKAEGAERKQLLDWATEAERARIEAEWRCDGTTCPRLAQTGFATGMVGSAAPGAFAGKSWGTTAFSPSQHAYREGVWRKPLLILTDQETWSAAEEFAAVLQDNKAAVVIGARTGGAGCGYVNGGSPTVLANSKGVLKLPDCARLRADGSNEVNGIIPDIPTAIRHDDGPAFKARLIAERLPEAIAKAEGLIRR